MKRVIVALVILYIFIGGCASMAKYDRGYVYPYSATTGDMKIIWLSATGYKGDPADPNPFDFLYSPWFIPLYIIDIPFSLVTDTLTVPYDLYHLNDIDGSQGVDNETHCK